MADQGRNGSSSPQRPQEPPRGIWAITHKIKFAIGVLIGSLFLGIFIEWAGIAFLWPEDGYKHSQAMLDVEIGWLSEDFTRSLVLSDPGQAAVEMTQTAYDWLFVKTGFIEWAAAARQPIDGNASGFRNAGYRVFQYLEDYLLSTVYMVLVFLVRLLILTLTMPLFIMAIVAGLVDGLVRRDLRRFGAGLESGFVYHHAKRMIVPLLFTAWVIYLSIPFSIHPNWVLLPCATMLGLTVSITAGSFKKYL